MKTILLSLSVLSMLTIVSCKKKDNGPSNAAQVMFVDGCAGATNVSATANGTAVPGAANMAYLKNSGYQNVTAGTSVPMVFTLMSTGTQLTTATQSITANTHYTAFAAGIITGSSFVFATDDLAAPAAGKAKIRFVNLSSDGLNASCYIGAAKVDSNVGYRTCTPFMEVTPTTANILLQDPAAPTSLAQLNAQTIASGKIYTVMLTGNASGSGVSVLSLTVINNN